MDGRGTGPYARQNRNQTGKLYLDRSETQNQPNYPPDFKISTYTARGSVGKGLDEYTTGCWNPNELQHKDGAEQGTHRSVNKSCYGCKSRTHHNDSRTSTQELV